MTTTPAGYTANKPNERYQNLNTGIVYLVVMDIGGAVELENIERRVLHKSRAELDSGNDWRKMP